MERHKQSITIAEQPADYRTTLRWSATSKQSITIAEQPADYRTTLRWSAINKQSITMAEQPADDTTTYLGLLQRRVEIISSAPPGMKLSQTENGDHLPQPPSTMVFRLSTSVKDVLLMSGHRLSWHSYRQRSQNVISHYQHVAVYGHVVSPHKHGVVAHGHFRFLNNARLGTPTDNVVKT